MSFPKINPTKTSAWQQLQDHFDIVKGIKMQSLFSENPLRENEFSIVLDNFKLDYSKNRITSETKKLLLDLAEEVKLKQAIEAQFTGESINETEDRQVLHTALRDFENMKPEVTDTLCKLPLKPNCLKVE